MKFAATIQALCDAGVEFVIIGGVAGNLHGSPRITWDLDICFARAPANLRRLAAALAPFHPKLRDLPEELPFIWDETTLRNGAVFTLRTDLGKIDLLAEIAGVGGYEEAKANSIMTESFGRRVAVLDLPTLIKAKRRGTGSRSGGPARARKPPRSYRTGIEASVCQHLKRM